MTRMWELMHKVEEVRPGSGHVLLELKQANHQHPPCTFVKGLVVSPLDGICGVFEGSWGCWHMTSLFVYSSTQNGNRTVVSAEVLGTLVRLETLCRCLSSSRQPGLALATFQEFHAGLRHAMTTWEIASTPSVQGTRRTPCYSCGVSCVGDFDLELWMRRTPKFAPLHAMGLHPVFMLWEVVW